MTILSRRVVRSRAERVRKELRPRTGL